MTRRITLSQSFISLCLLVVGTVTHAHEVAFEKDSNLPIVYINVAVMRGSTTDPLGQGGLTNFMGEMLTRGTSTKSKEQIDLALDKMGARLDVETRAEALIFRGAVLSSQLEPYLKLVTEILTQPSFPESEIQKLKSEILSGIQEELGHDSSLASRKFTEFLFRGHPYGKPVIGKIKDITDLTKEQIAAQYNRLVRDHFLLIVGSGDVDSDRISVWADELGSARPDINLSEAESKLLSKVSAPENPDHRRLLIIDKPDRTQTQIDFGQIGVRMTDSNFFPIYLANHAFGGGSFSAVLMTEIRVKRGWSYGAGSHFRFGLQPRSWIGHLFPASKDTAPALALSLKLIDELKQKGLSKEKFEFAQQSLVNSSGFMYNTPRKRVENKLLEKTLDLPDGFMKSYGNELKKVKLEQVNNALKDFLQPSRLSMSVLCTAKDLKAKLIQAAGVSPAEVSVIPYTQQ